MPKRTSQNEEVNDDGTGGVYDRQAITYASVRPDYPDQVFSTIAQYTNLSGGARVLEIGSGAGQATAAMAARDWRIDARTADAGSSRL